MGRNTENTFIEYFLYVNMIHIFSSFLFFKTMNLDLTCLFSELSLKFFYYRTVVDSHVMSASGIQQSDSVTHTYIYVYIYIFFFRSFSLIGYTKY